jgi:hypothetical protein
MQHPKWSITDPTDGQPDRLSLRTIGKPGNVTDGHTDVLMAKDAIVPHEKQEFASGRR